MIRGEVVHTAPRFINLAGLRRRRANVFFKSHLFVCLTISVTPIKSTSTRPYTDLHQICTVDRTMAVDGNLKLFFSIPPGMLP